MKRKIPIPIMWISSFTLAAFLMHSFFCVPLYAQDTLRPQPPAEGKTGLEERLNPRAELEEDRFTVYLDAEIKEGHLVGTPSPLMTARALHSTFWNRADVKEAKTVIFAGKTTFKTEQQSNVSFSIRGHNYSTNRRFRLDHPLRLLIVVDPKTYKPTAAFDMETGEKVYEPANSIKVYLNPKIEKGRPVGDPITQGKTVSASLWKMSDVQAAEVIGLDGITTFNRSGMTGFQIGRNRQYSTNLRFDPQRQVKLLVLLDRSHTPIEVFDPSGQQVYGLDDQIKIYLNPTIQDGKLYRPGKPFDVVRIIRLNLWERIGAQTDQLIALEGVPTSNQKNIPSFSLDAELYPTTRRFDSKNPLRLLVLADPVTRKPLSAYDLNTGDQVYDAGSLIQVYLDPEVQRGKLVNPSEPYRRVGLIQPSLWQEDLVKKASVVAFSGVEAFRSVGSSTAKSVYSFSTAAKVYRTDRFFNPDKPLQLLVLANPKAKTPTAAFDLETGDQVYDVESLIKAYINPLVQGGRLVESSMPFRSMRGVRPSFWKEPEVVGATLVGFNQIPVFHQKGFETFNMAGKMYTTSRRFTPDSDLHLLVLVDPRTKIPVAAYDSDTGEQVYPKPTLEADARLKVLTDAVTDGTWAASDESQGPHKAGLEETVVWKVAKPMVLFPLEADAPPTEPEITTPTAADGITVPIPLSTGPRALKLKIVLPDVYRHKGKRDVTVGVTHYAAQVYPQPDGRLLDGYVLRAAFEHQGKNTVVYFYRTNEGTFAPIVPGLTPLTYMALSPRLWLSPDKYRPLGPFTVLTTAAGYMVEIGRGVYPNGDRTTLRILLPKERYKKAGIHPVHIKTQWQARAYLSHDGTLQPGYIVAITVDPGTPTEAVYRYRFTGEDHGFASFTEDALLEEVREAVAATHGGFAGELLDVLLTLYGEQYTEEEIRIFVRRFSELELGELAQGHEGWRGRGRLLLEFFFKQASLIAAKSQRDQETIISVYLKVAFRDLVKPDTRNELLQLLQGRIQQLAARIEDLEATPASETELKEAWEQMAFFDRLLDAIRELTDNALQYHSPYLKTQLLPHQAVGGYFLKRHPRAFLGDFTGAGKSIEVLSTLDPSEKSCIAAPAGLLDNWLKEIGKHLTPEALSRMEVVVLPRGEPTKRQKMMDELRDRKGVLILVSVESLRRSTRKSLEGLNHGLNLFVLDESQVGANYRGPDAQTNAQQAEGLQLMDGDRKYYLSATGYGADPSGLFATLHALTNGVVGDQEGAPDRDKGKFRDYREFRRLYPTTTAAGLRYIRAEMRRLSLCRQPDEVMERYVDPSIIPLEKQGKRLPNLIEVPYHQLGTYELNDEQERLLLMMIRNFRDFAEWYNERVPEPQQLREEQMNPFTKLRFIMDVMVDPTRVGGETQSNLWEEVGKVGEHYMEEGKKGIFYTTRTYVASRLMDQFSHPQQGIRPARIDTTVTGYQYGPDGRIIKGYDGPDGDLILDLSHPDARNIAAKTYERHRFQNEAGAQAAVVGVRAGGMGLDMTAAEFMIQVPPLPDVYTQDLQADGRPMRVDEKRPRYQVHKVRMVPVFRNGFARRWAGTEYADLARRLEESGTPGEIQVERLAVGKRVFEYVMTDLATQEEIDLFSPGSLARAIPGFNEDPTMEQYLNSLGSRRLRQTLEIFHPLYEKASTDERKQEIIALADLYFRTGELPDLQRLILLIAQEDESVMRMVSSLREIPNKYSRNLWVQRIIQLVLTDLQENGVPLNDIAEGFDFLMEEAPYLVLPVYDTAKGYENGSVLPVLTHILSEVMESEDRHPQRRRLIYQQFALWLLAVHQGENGSDARDWLREVMDLYGGVFVDLKISLQERLGLLEQLLRTIRYPETRQILLRDQPSPTAASLRERLQQATIAAAQRVFGLNTHDASQLVKVFPAVLSALQVHRPMQEKYPEQAQQLNEIVQHIAQEDYPSWRNKQGGERRAGEYVTYRDDEPQLWDIFTREERFGIPGGIILGYEQHRAQLIKMVQELVRILHLGHSFLIGEVDGEWVQETFVQWAPSGLAAFRNDSKAKRSLLAKNILNKVRQGTPYDSLTRKEQDALQTEGFDPSLTPAHMATAIENRLAAYGRVEEWLSLDQQLSQLLADGKNNPTPKQIADLKHSVGRLSGRTTRSPANHMGDRMDQFLQLLEHLRDRVNYDGLTVQLTTDPSFMLDRGMLHPFLVDCFNCYADPDQTSALPDDLGSRNKILALVWPAGVEPTWENRDKILTRAVVKMKRTKEEVPAIFPERPLSTTTYDFEDEILKAIRVTKMSELAKFGVRLAREDAVEGSEEATFYETGGYSAWEYIEPLFKILKRTHRTQPIHHRGVLLPMTMAGLEEDRVDIYFDPLIKGGGPEKGTQPDLPKVRLSQLDFSAPEFRTANKIAIKGILVLRDPETEMAVFRIIGEQPFITDRLFEPASDERLLVLLKLNPLDPKSPEIIAAYNKAREKVYPPVEEEGIEVFLEPVVADGRMDANERPRFKTRFLGPTFWGIPAIKASRWVGLRGVPTIKTKDEMPSIKIGRKQVIVFTTQPFIPKQKLLVIVQPNSSSQSLPIVTAAYDIDTNDQVYPPSSAPPMTTDDRLSPLAEKMTSGQGWTMDPGEDTQQSGLEEKKIQVYGDVEIKDGKLVGNPAPIREVVNLRLRSDGLTASDLQKFKRIVLSNVSTTKQGVRAGFYLFSVLYPTTRMYDAAHPLRLLVEIDAERKIPTAAYDMETGEQVYAYSDPDLIDVYGDIEIRDGKLVGDPAPIRQVGHLNSEMLTNAEFQGMNRLVLGNVGTHQQGNNAGFSLFNVRYYTTRAYDAAHPVRLLVEADVKNKIPLAAYDMATGTQVYPTGLEKVGKQEIPKADERLGELAKAAESGQGWTEPDRTDETNKSTSGLEEAIGEVLTEWTSHAQGTDAIVLSPEISRGPSASAIQIALTHLPSELAQRIYLVGSEWAGLEERNPALNLIPSGSAEDVTVRLIQHSPAPETVWVVGNLGPVLQRLLLNNFHMTVQQLTAGAGLEEFLIQLGYSLGIPSTEIEAGLEQIWQKRSVDSGA